MPRAERTHLGRGRRDGKESEYALARASICAQKERKREKEERQRSVSSGLARVTNSLRGLLLSEVTGHKVMTVAIPPEFHTQFYPTLFAPPSLSLSLRASARFLHTHSFLSTFPCHRPHAIPPAALFIEELLRCLMVSAVSSTMLCPPCVSRRLC